MVAETLPETKTEEQTQTPPEKPPEEPESQAQEAPPSGQDTEAQEAEAGAEPEFDAEAIIEQVTGKKAASQAEEAPQLPGRSLEEVQAQQAQVRAQNYLALLTQGERTFVPRLAKDLGIAESEAQVYFNQLVRPYLDVLHQNNEDFNTIALQAAIDAALATPERIKAFRSKVYGTRQEAMAALLALGASEKDAEWKARIDKGEYVSRAEARKIAESAVAEYRRRLEEKGLINGARSGQRVAGGEAVTSNEQAERVLESATSSLAAKKAAFKQLYGIDYPG